MTNVCLIFAICILPLESCHSDDMGAVSGFVKFPGETPPPSMYANESDHDCPHGIGQNHLIVKQETLGLKNVLVVLERTDRRVMPTRLSVELAMDGCRLLPRIFWVPLGTSLALTDKDGARHHLRALQKGNTLFEADLSPDTPSVRRPMVVPGLYQINCDHHPWERAWIYSSPHDSVAITDAEGRFVIKGVPPGRYVIHAWHEGWVPLPVNPGGGHPEFVPMRDVRTIKVRADQTTDVLFDTLSSLADPSFPN